jgi:DNA topoisomerase-1
MSRRAGIDAARLFAPEPPARLVYVSDAMPGIRRERRGDAFVYRDSEGRTLVDPEALARIRRLAIPPAYTDVWICPIADGHLQATARDARGRKQYRYHPQWREQRDADKFDRLIAFGRALPRVRARVARDLAAGGRGAPSREVVLATIVQLLDTTFLRVGNDEYARSNGSYGLTTLRDRHAGIKGSRLRLSFRGKSGVRHEVEIDDPRIARVVRRCQAIPGQELFQYVDADGSVRSVGSGDVNDYLGEAAGGERFTAKDFRTWHGTVQALELTRLACSGAPEGKTTGAGIAQQVLAEVARRLGNTPAVCRKAYIHPRVLELGKALGGNAEAMQALSGRLGAGKRRTRGLQAAEWRLLAFLRRGGGRESAQAAHA